MSGMDELLDEQGAEPVVEPTPAPAPEAAPQAPSSEAAPVQPETPPAALQPAPSKHQDQMAPVRALLDEREKRRAAEARAAQLEAWRAEQERKRQEAQAQAPNLLEDPEGYHAYWENRHKELERGFNQRLSTTLMRERIETSQERWTEKLGEDGFKELYAWSATMPPQWVKWAESQRDPFGVAYKEFEKQKKAKQAEELIAQTGGKSIDEIVAERVAAELAKHNSAPASQPAPAASAQPRTETGQFAPNPQPTQRHRPESLAKLNGSTVHKGSTPPGSALEGLIGD